MKRQTYLLIDPRTQKVRYVGSSASINRRLYQHFRGGTYTSPVLVKKWLDELANLELSPVYKLAPERSERDCIAYYRSIDQADLNAVKQPFSPEHRAAISRSSLALHKSMSTELKTKMTQGRLSSPLWRAAVTAPRGKRIKTQKKETLSGQ